ncbi:MAG: PLP-dependent transferase, partial [Luteibaculum sp.]
MSNKYRFGTKAIHAGVEPDPSTGAIMTPVFQSSTYVQEAVGKHKGYQYSRSQNPTRSALEKNIAALENAAYAAIFASGMAATDCLLRTLKPGDEVIATNDLYGGTYRIFKTVFEPLGIKFHFTSFSEPEKIRPLISEQTKLIWLESPSNPMLSIVDIKAIASIKSGSRPCNSSC